MPIYFSRDNDRDYLETTITEAIKGFERLTKCQVKAISIERGAFGIPTVAIKTNLPDDEMKKVYRDMYRRFN